MKMVDVQADSLVVGDVLYTADHKLVEITALGPNIYEFLFSFQGTELINGLPVSWEGNRHTLFTVRR